MKQPPTPEEIADWNRWFAVEMNNLAWEIVETPARTPTQSEEMLHAAHAAAIHWSKVGTALNHARAEMLLGEVHALLGNGRLAMSHAQRSFDYLTSIESPDWELAFAHAVLAHAAFAAQQYKLHAKHHALAQSLGAAIRDDKEREIFLRTFDQVPKATNTPA